MGDVPEGTRSTAIAARGSAAGQGEREREEKIWNGESTNEAKADEGEAVAMTAIEERCGEPGVVGSDKRFLFDIVANKCNGLDVDKLDYYERDSHFSGVVKLSFR